MVRLHVLPQCWCMTVDVLTWPVTQYRVFALQNVHGIVPVHCSRCDFEFKVVQKAKEKVIGLPYMDL